MGSSEEHALTTIRLSDGTIIVTISVEEFNRDINALASNINVVVAFSSFVDAKNHHPGVHYDSEGVEPVRSPERALFSFVLPMSEPEGPYTVPLHSNLPQKTYSGLLKSY